MQRYTKGDEIAFKQRLDEVLRSAQTVVVTSHKRPDDDSISSVLSLYLYLSRTYPQISLHISYAGEALTR